MILYALNDVKFDFAGKKVNLEKGAPFEVKSGVYFIKRAFFKAQGLSPEKPIAEEVVKESLEQEKAAEAPADAPAETASETVEVAPNTASETVTTEETPTEEPKKSGRGKKKEG